MWREGGYNGDRSQSYTSYKARPFTREQRDTTTILFVASPGSTNGWSRGFQHQHYRRNPAQITRADLDAQELIDVGACCPTIFTTAARQLPESRSSVNGKQPTIDNYVFLTAALAVPAASANTTIL